MPKLSAKNGDSMATVFGHTVPECNSGNSNTVKRCYKKGSLKYHPDKNPGNQEAEENFKLLGQFNNGCEKIQDQSPSTCIYKDGPNPPPPSDGRGPSMGSYARSPTPPTAPHQRPTQQYASPSAQQPQKVNIKTNYANYMMYAVSIIAFLMVGILRKSGGNSGSNDTGFGHGPMGFGGGNKGKAQTGGMNQLVVTLFVTFLVTLCKMPQVIATGQELGKSESELYDDITGLVVHDAASVVESNNLNGDGGMYSYLTGIVDGATSYVWTTEEKQPDTLVPAFISSDNNPFPVSDYFTSKNYLDVAGVKYELNTITLENLERIGIQDTGMLHSLVQESATELRDAGRMLAQYMTTHKETLVKYSSDKNLRTESSVSTIETEVIYDVGTGMFNLDALSREMKSLEDSLKSACTAKQYSKPQSFATLLGTNKDSHHARLAAMGSVIEEDMTQFASDIGTQSKIPTSDITVFAIDRYSSCQAAWTHYDIMKATYQILQVHGKVGTLNVRDITIEQLHTIMNDLITTGGINALQDFKTVMGAAFNPSDANTQAIMNKLSSRLTGKLEKDNKGLGQAIIEAVESGESMLIATAAEPIIILTSSAVLGGGYSGITRMTLSSLSSSIPNTTPRGNPWNPITGIDFFLNIIFCIWVAKKGIGILGKTVTEPIADLRRGAIEDKKEELLLDTQRKLLENGLVPDPTQGLISTAINGPRYVQISDMGNQITQGNPSQITQGNPSQITPGNPNPNQITQGNLSQITPNPDQISSSPASLPEGVAQPPLVIIPPSSGIFPPLPTSIAVGQTPPSMFSKFKGKVKGMFSSKPLQLTNGPTQTDTSSRDLAAAGLLALGPQKGGKKRSVKKHKKRRKHTKKLNKKNRSKKNRRKKHKTVKRRNKKTARRRR